MSVQEKIASISKLKAALVGLIIGGGYYVLAEKGENAIQQATELRTQVGEIQIQIDKNAAALSDFETFKKNVDFKNQKYVEALEYLTADLKTADVLTHLAQKIEGAGGKVNIIQPGEIQKKAEFLEEHPYYVAFEGNFHNIIAFLSELTKTNMVSHIRDVVIDGLTSNQNANIRIKATVVFFKYLPNKVIGGPANSAGTSSESPSGSSGGNP